MFILSGGGLASDDTLFYVLIVCVLLFVLAIIKASDIYRQLKELIHSFYCMHGEA